MTKPLVRKTGGLTGPEQLVELQSLKVTSAAWLAGVPQCTLRDNAHTLSPKHGNVYDARDVLQWAATRGASVQMSDEDQEKLLRLADRLASEFDPGTRLALSMLRELADRYGPHALTVAARAMCDAMGDLDSELPLPAADAVQGSQRTRVLWDRMELATVCETCKRTRCGPRWKKITRAKDDSDYLLGQCPECEDDEHER